MVLAVSDELWKQKDYSAIVANVQADLPRKIEKHRIVVLQASQISAMSASKLGEALGLPLKPIESFPLQMC